MTRGDYVANEGGFEFRPTTTVHDVALIPNYFSSGEEDQEQRDQRASLENILSSNSTPGYPAPLSQLQQPMQQIHFTNQYGPNIYKTPNQPSSFQRQLQSNLNPNYFYRTPASHQVQTISNNSIDDVQFMQGYGPAELQHQHALSNQNDQILIEDGDFDRRATEIPQQ